MEEVDYRRWKKKRLRLNARRRKCHFVKKSKVWPVPEENSDPVPGEIEIISDAAKFTDRMTERYDSPDRKIQTEYNVSCNTTPSSISQYNLNIEPENETNESDQLEGRRIIEIKHLFESIKNIKHLHTDCNFSHLTFVKEIRQGFKSEFIFVCKMCKKKETIKSENPNNKVDINMALVEGTICTGNGYSQLEEISAVINMPCMSNHTFQKIENSLKDCFEDCALDEMLAAGQEEKRLAILNNDVDVEGYPLIPVVADGSWAKRSYKSGYSSLSGAACIIGYRTKKVLFLGIRNKYCCVCSKAINKNTPVPEHKCFKNWSGSSTSMEEDIIVEGFQRSVEMHGLKYNQLIGDGDSGIINKLLMTMLYGPNLVVKKVECKNHLLRNFCTKIKQLGKKTNNHKGYVSVETRKKVENSVMRLRKAVTGAIHFHKNKNTSDLDKIVKLKHDIRNSANHVFGKHDQCADYFCKHPSEKNTVPELEECGIWVDIQKCLSILVNNAGSLILDVTNNCAEQFHSIIAKFIGGKRVNFTSRGSYQTRCFGALTSWNSKAATHYRLQKKISNRSPGQFTKRYTERRRKNLENASKRKLDFSTKAAHVPPAKRSRICEPDEHYGILELEEDMATEVYEKKKEEFLSTLIMTKEQKKQIEQNTLGQSDNNVWLIERRKRLTASMFGQICKMRRTTSCLSTIKSLLYSNFAGNSATKYGKEHESEAIREFTKETNLEVTPCGLFIHDCENYLGASPDGIIGDNAIIEVKCPSSIASMSPLEAIENKKVKFCQLNDGQMTLKRNHNYFYQVQGQLQVTGRQYCYFVVWTPKGLIYQKIERDDHFWSQEMQPKLKTFYFQCLLPELIDPRIPRKMTVRERIFP